MFWAVVALCFTAVGMRDLSWKFYHRWWQPKLHHIILEVEASGGDPVTLTPAQWAEASARGAAASGSGGGGAEGGHGGGGGGGGSSSARVAGVGSGVGGSSGSGRTHRCGVEGSEETGSMAPSRRSSLTDQLTVGHDSVGGSAGGEAGGRAGGRQTRGSRRNSELLESEWLEAGGVPLPRDVSPGGGVEMGVGVFVGSGGRRGIRERRDKARRRGKGRASAAVAGGADGASSGGKGPVGAVYSDGVELGFGNDVGDAVWRRHREEFGGGDRRRHVLAGLLEGEEEGGRAEAPYGSGGGGSQRGLLEEDDEGYAAVHRRHTDSMSSLPSPGLAEGYHGGVTVTPATSHSRSLSWVRRRFFFVLLLGSDR